MTVESEDAFDWLTPRRQLWLWVLALLLYGVGDTATTIVGVETGHVAEAGPIASGVIARYGGNAMVALKVVVFGGFYAAWRWLDTPGRVAIPTALSLVGAVVTGWNALVLLAA